jgi:NAD(P)-dependent dehydrogenase (short-subunit alcohol dehydrogenase family)
MLEATAALYSLYDIDALAENQLLRRTLEPDEVAATIVSCCGREAGALNGSVTQADGGFVP